MGEWKEKYERFKEWQRQPHQVKPMSQEAHDCPTCGTHFEGNYCPRCGQSAMIGRYSFKKAFLLFLDVWGLGNRGMFRSIRDLILRPGYMIRDYLQGMQMAYFPPFKMFFLLVALSLLVETGMNIRFENRLKTQEAQIFESMNNNLGVKEESETVQQAEQEIKLSSIISPDAVYDWMTKHQSPVIIALILLFTGPLYLFFRRSPAYPDIKFSEFFVAVVYTTNMMTIYSIISNFFCLPVMVELFSYVLAIIPLKQLSGYSYWRTFINMVLALILFVIIFVFLIVVGTVIFSLFSKIII